jgi:hypothetical protein
METNSEKRRLGVRVWAAGVVGAIVGALVVGFIPSARGQTPSTVFIAGENNLSVELLLEKKAGKSFTLRNCLAREGKDSMPKLCDITNDLTKSNALADAYYEAVLIRWNGQSGGSGCAKVAGVEYCW